VTSDGEAASARATRADDASLAAAALAKVAVQFLAIRRYGYFRDELYYLACSDHPAAGYVDQPPFSILFLRLWRAVFGDSLVALRMPAVLAGAATVVLTGLIARRLGGGRFAQILAALAAIAAPMWLGMNGYFSMNSFDILFWTLAAYLLIVLFRSEPGPRVTRSWLALGVVLGFGLENKISVLWLGCGLFAGLLLTKQRRWLKTPGPWLAGALAGLLFLPHVLWQVRNGWPTLEFMRNATSGKYKAIGPVVFLVEQLLMMNPLAAPLWIAGLAVLLFSKDNAPFRPIGVLYLAVFVILAANGKAKPEYLSPAYSPLFAAGAVALERWLARRSLRWTGIAYAVLLAAGGAVIAPLAIPILPVPTYIAYARALGQEPSTPEKKEVGALPQHYADMFGWFEMVDTIAQAWSSLPESERRIAGIYVRNYGEAGALDFFGRKYGLPPALAAHNNYFLWGLHGTTGEVLIVYGGKKEDHERVFERVELAALFEHPYVMPYENHRPVWICRRLKMSLADVWPGEKNFS
jgi:hypothetical protein